MKTYTISRRYSRESKACMEGKCTRNPVMFVTMSDVFDGNVYVGSDKHTSNVNRAILVAEIECSEQGGAEPWLLSKKAGTLP